MKNHPCFLLTFIIFVLFQSWFAYVSLNQPIIGVNLQKDNQTNKWMISSFDSRSAGKDAGLQIGDIIESINGSSPDQYRFVEKWHTLDQSKIVQLSRNGKLIVFDSSNIPNITSYDALALAGEMICIVAAFILYKKLPNSRSAAFLALLFLLGSFMFMGLTSSIKGDPAGKAMVSILLATVPIVFLHFLIIFFKEKANVLLSSGNLKMLYTIVVCMAFSSLSFFINTPLVYYVRKYLTFLAMLMFIIIMILNLALLCKLYLKHRSTNLYVKTVIKTVGLSLLISILPLACFSIIPNMITHTPIFDSLYMSCFIFLFPLSFAYLITTKKLYNIDFIVRRVLVTLVISLVPSGLIMAVAYALFPASINLNNMLALFFFVLTLQSLVLYSLEYFTSKLEPVMFPQKHQLESSLKKLSRNLQGSFNLRELRDVMLVDVVNTFQLYGGAIVYRYAGKTETISEGEIDIAEVETIIESNMLNHPSYSIYEINRNEEFTTFLVLTQKRSKTLIGVEERQWLNIIISYLTVSLENIYLIRKLSHEVSRLAAQIPNEEAAEELIWFRKLMFELQESERVRIATELHDTTMQDLFFLKERFASLVEKYAFTQEDKAQLESFINYIDIINANLRQSCFELHPHLIKEIGLVATIEEMVNFEKAVTPFDIAFTASRSDLIELQDLETKRHLFRMIQELVNNAKKHSQATLVQISLEAGTGYIRLEYRDNGVGFDLHQPKEKEIASSGIGMEQMKGRVLSLNGRYQLEASQGDGMTFSATIPLKEGKTA